MHFTGSPSANRTATLGSADLQLCGLQRLAAARDVLSALLEGHLDASPEVLDAVSLLVGRASSEMRLAREIEIGAGGG